MSKVSENNFFQSLIKFAPEILIFIGFFMVQSILLNNDFWNDELYTLDKFTFVPIAQTLSDYHVPNNHILFNFINNIYLKIIGIDSLNNLMETPWKLRVVPLFYSFITLVFTYKIGREFFSRNIGIIASVVLITTIPFFSYSLQIRGYGLSTLFLTALIYYSFSFVKQKSNKFLIATILCTSLLFFTIPSNIYYLVCFIFILGILSIIKALKGRKFNFKTLFVSEYSKLIYSIILGIGIALLLFIPVFNQVFNNEYVNVRGAPFEFWKLDFYFSHVFEGGFSGKTIFIATSIGVLVLINFYKKEWRKYFLVFIALVILPFFIPYLRGDDPPIRVFVVSMPFFSLFLAISIVLCFTFLIKEKKYHKGITIGIIAYCFIIFGFEVSKIKKQTLHDIETGDRSHSLYRQFHTFKYQPLSDMKSFSGIYETSKLPVKIVGCEAFGIPKYLNKYNIPFAKDSDDLGSYLELHDSCYLVTSKPNSFEEFQEYDFTILSEKLTYHTIVKVKRK
ncbi:glycosyltransferase family 39 protein [Flavobacteriales bacterium]|nr:glycosyltransferase family 39 protein [Flavobacteriales bacterium]